ncbi:hypothetical protein HD554DRAFT_2176293 [Boletus coccyginus]|nr:hypothetical protein HD554DRAFT_2176293 [Boletus coccyginus]
MVKALQATQGWNWRDGGTWQSQHAVLDLARDPEVTTERPTAAAVVLVLCGPAPTQAQRSDFTQLKPEPSVAAGPGLVLGPALAHFLLTASYDGLLDYAQKPVVQDVAAHQAPTTSVYVVPSLPSTDESVVIAGASHDLTASLTRVSLAPDASPPSQTIASLHLHTSPLSFVSSDHTSSRLLTASWDQVCRAKRRGEGVHRWRARHPCASGERERALRPYTSARREGKGKRGQVDS